ncbi:MAG TPA: hypothetical protein VLF68_02505 [Candidatus Saccharimonadales bacterium]|nr:hypothetical protein [Candidatus Saccharimonadales bacterium]
MKKILTLIFAVILLTLIFVTSPKQSFAACTAGPATNLTATPTGNRGQVLLTWTPAMNGNMYHLVFGSMTNTYVMGALNVGGTGANNYTVNLLNPGQRYFFNIWSMCSTDGPATPSNEAVSASQ